MNAERPAFERSDATHFVGERGIACRTDAHLVGKWGRTTQIDCIGNEVTAAGTKGGTGLEVRADEQRQCRGALQRIRLDRDVNRAANGDDGPAEFLLANQSFDTRPRRVVHRGVVAEDPRPDHLARLVA